MLKKAALFIVSAALFTGLLSMSGGVFAEVDDQYDLKVKQGEICPVDSAGQCGFAKAKGQLRVLASDDGEESGDGRLVITIQGFNSQQEDSSLISNSLEWIITSDAFELNGHAQDQDGNSFNIDMNALEIHEKKKKTEMTLQIMLERVSDGAKFTIETSSSLITSPLPPG